MPRDYAALAPHEVRRRDRAVTDETWIQSFLERAPYGVMASVHNGQPFVNSNLFVYNAATHMIYLHTARVGRTQANVDAEDEEAAVCFSAFRMGRMLPAAEALKFSVEYEGVVAFGKASIIRDEEHASAALQLLLDKYAPHLRPGRDYRPVVSEELKRTAVFQIAIDSWSGKRKHVEPDFPGAYRFDGFNDGF